MPSTLDKQRLFENIVRLRRAERELSDDRDVLAVRTDLEEELGPTVSRALAARFLGLSHPALNRWARSGDLPLVFTPQGRTEVPVSVLVPLYEAVEEGRRTGRRHVLEPVLKQARANAEALDPERLVAEELDDEATLDRHRVSELRSLAYHRVVAARLTPLIVDDVRRLLWQWERGEKIDARSIERWREILDRPMDEIRAALGDDAQPLRELRQSSPFAGLLTEPERRKIIERIG